MFDFVYQAEARQSQYEERLQRALANAEREWNREKPARSATYRQVLARLGAALVTVGTWLQGSPTSEPAIQFNPAHNR